MGEFKDAAEAVLAALAGAGDEEAFDELIRRKQSYVRGFMRRLCNDAALADDLAQQTFIEMWKGISKLQNPQAFTGWLKKIAVYVWLQYARKKDPFNQNIVDEKDDFSDISTSFFKPHERIDLNSALNKLASEVRLCIVLFYQFGMSHSEISSATRFPLGTVKSHISRGSILLKSWLSDYGEEK